MPGPLSFSAGEAFGPNVQGVLAYLGAAIEHRAGLDAVLPAWRTLLAIAPELHDADQLRYPMLLWIARIVYHDIGGQPLGEVAERLYADVQAARSSRHVERTLRAALKRAAHTRQLRGQPQTCTGMARGVLCGGAQKHHRAVW